MIVPSNEINWVTPKTQKNMAMTDESSSCAKR